MANPERAPVLFEHGETTYRFVLNNGGKRAAEKAAGMGFPEIADGFFNEDEFGITRPSVTSISAMFWGATRRFHGARIRNMAQVDAILDEVESAGDDTAQELFRSLAAAALNIDKEDLVADASETPEDAEDSEATEEEGDAEQGMDPGAEEAPSSATEEDEEAGKGEEKPKRGRGGKSRTNRGTSS